MILLLTYLIGAILMQFAVPFLRSNYPMYFDPKSVDSDRSWLFATALLWPIVLVIILLHVTFPKETRQYSPLKPTTMKSKYQYRIYVFILLFSLLLATVFVLVDYML